MSSFFQGDLRQERDYHSTFPFSFLSELSSDHTYIIISAEIDSKLHQTLRENTRYELEMQCLSIEQRRSYIEMFFQRFNKVSEGEKKRNCLYEMIQIRLQTIPFPK